MARSSGYYSDEKLDLIRSIAKIDVTPENTGVSVLTCYVIC